MKIRVTEQKHRVRAYEKMAMPMRLPRGGSLCCRGSWPTRLVALKDDQSKNNTIFTLITVFPSSSSVAARMSSSRQPATPPSPDFLRCPPFGLAHQMLRSLLRLFLWCMFDGWLRLALRGRVSVPWRVPLFAVGVRLWRSFRGLLVYVLPHRLPHVAVACTGASIDHSTNASGGYLASVCSTWRTPETWIYNWSAWQTPRYHRT